MKFNRIPSTIVAALVLVVFVAPFSTSAADLGGDGWYDAGTYAADDGWYDVGTYASNDGWYDAGSYASDDWYDAGSDWYDAGYSDWYDAGYSDWYDAGYDYHTPSYSYGGSGGGFDWGCGSFCGGSSYSPPRYTPPVIKQPAYPSSNINTNTITNTNVNNVTNIDNSIRDSFNNYNSNNTSLVMATPQMPVVYNPPVTHHAAPYCYINNAQGNYGSGAYLAWSSVNAVSAYLSNVGSVGTSGSQTVYPGSGMTYTLTVYGHNGQSATCSTYVSGTAYVPPVVHQPYVALTQIPYTGFDLGPIGNAMYWVALMSFAVAGAYLVVYYLPGQAGRGGALAFATAMVPTRTQKPLPAVVAPKAPILVEKEAAEAAYVASVASIRKAGTTDTMAIIDRKDGSMPKIVIHRN